MSERPSEQRRIVVDFIACDGHGICADLLPENFRLDDWGYPIITDDVVPAERMRDARRTVKLCPELAIRLEEIRGSRRPRAG